MGDAVLILSRRRGESILIGDDIEIAVVDLKGGQVKIGIRAPRSLVVDRKEIADRKATEAELRDLLHVDAVVALPAGEFRTLRPGIDYDADAVCPGCGCFRDKCACDIRGSAPTAVLFDEIHTAETDPNNGLPEPSKFPPMPAVQPRRGNMSGTARIKIAKVFSRLSAGAAETSVGGPKKTDADPAKNENEGITK